MRIYRVKDNQQMSRKAANFIAAQVLLKPDSVLGLATGSTPEGTYRKLIEAYESGDLDFSQVRSVNLDEYKGLTAENDQSYNYYMNKNLFSKVNIRPENTYLPDGMAEDGDAEGARYDAIIESLGGIDLQLLGLGANGHIGFNEPDSCFAKGTHCVALTESTISANARFFASADLVPRFAYSMGVQSIMRAKRILLIASGEGKADALYRMICGEITPQVPASALQLHPDVTVIADEAALSKVNG